MSQKKKTTAQSKRPRKAPSNQTGGTAWGKKAAAAISGKMQSADVKKLILLNFPYIFFDFNAYRIRMLCNINIPPLLYNIIYKSSLLSTYIYELFWLTDRTM